MPTTRARSWFRTLLAAGLIGVCGVVQAEAGALRFRTLSNAQGLSENSVKAFAEDSRGFLWIGTEHGLNRFDGLEFRVFTAGGDPERELLEDHINALLVGRDGKLWIGTFGGGLSCYDPDTGVFTSFLHDPDNPASLGSNDVSAIHEDGAGRLWVGTQGGGLSRLDPATGAVSPVQLAAAADRPTAEQVTALAGDGAGGLWIGTLDGGLFRLDASQAAAPQPVARAQGDDAESVPERDVTTLLLDSRQSLWVGTRRKGLSRRLPSGEWQRYLHDAQLPASLAHNTVNRLYEDGQGRLWVATARGLDQYLPASDDFSHNRHDPSDDSTLPYTDIYAVFEDSLGTLWVGTGGGGAALHAPPGRQFSIFEHDPADPRGTNPGGVWSLLEDERGTLWVGTLAGGLQTLAPDAKHFSSYRQQSDAVEPLSDNDVRGLAEDASGRLWIATRHGLNALDRSSGRVRQYLHDPARSGSLGHDYVRPLLVDGQGQLWVGTYGGGLDRYVAERDEFVHYRHDPGRADSLSDDRVYSLLGDAAGTLWVGTHGGGLNRLDVDNGRFTRFQHHPRQPDSLANNRVLALQRDLQGRLWVGTGSGLDRFDPGTGRFLHQDGLQNNLIYGIAVDAAGQLWLSTDDGMVRLDPLSGQLQRYPMRELWGNSEFNGGAWHRGRSGRLYFGGVSGVVRVTPDSTPDPRGSAEPVLTDFMLFNRSVKPVALDPGSPLSGPIESVGHIVLDHQDTVFGFAFAAVRATHPERRLFAYRLDGFDDRWLETRASRRDATYTGVPAGSYTFRVRTTDAEGAWLPKEAAVRLTVEPAPWRSSAAYAGYGAVVLALVAYWLWTRLRRQRIEREQQRALRQSEERLSLALWGSGDELLDWDLGTGTLMRLGGESGREARATRGVRDIEALATLVHPEDFPAVREALKQHFAGQTSHLEVSYRAREHGKHWAWKLVRAQVVARDAGGAPLRFSGTQNDISRIKAVESQLRELNEALDERVRQRSRELEERQGELVEAEKMASLGRLVAGVAHEVNTPLGVSVTAVSYLRGQIAALRVALTRLLPAEQVEQVVGSIDRASEMTENNLQRAATLVKTFKQVAVDQANPEFRTIKVRESLESTLQSLRPRLKQTGHRIELRCEPHLEMTGRTDVLYQIVVNLVMNSVMHAFAEGVAGEIGIDVESVDSLLRLTYSDNGVGMDPDVASRIFEPFFTTRRGSGGTGLGMHIVFNLVTQALAGRITCVTAPGQGVRFVIEFPQVHPRSA